MQTQQDKTSSTDEIIKHLKAHSKQAQSARAGAAAPVKGWLRRGAKYQALIGVGKKKVYLGTFDTPEAATEAYKQALVERDALRG